MNQTTTSTLPSKFGWRRIAFSLVVLAYVGFLGFINALMFLPAVGLLPDNALSGMGHFGSFLSTGDTHDLIHEFVFAFIVGTAGVGLLSQLWKPKEKFAGQLVALIAWGAMILTALITNNWVPQQLFIIFGGLTLIATILHPAERGLFTWFNTIRVNRVLLALVIIAAIPLLVLAFTNIGLQIAGGRGTGFFGHNSPAFHGGNSANQESSQEQPSNDAGGMATDDEVAHDQKHSALGHYRNLAVLSLIVILVGILASLRPPGWRFAAWVAGFLPILLGLVSVVLPDAESSLGLTWGLAGIVWGAAFIATAEFIRRRDIREVEKR